MTDTLRERAGATAGGDDPIPGRDPSADALDGPTTPGEPPPPSRVERAPSVIRGGAAAESSGDVKSTRVGQVLAGRYRIEKEIGSGGMGAVFRAEHVHMRKTIAVKVLHREMTYLPEVVARFEREAVAAARIEHPHVAAATDFGQLDDGSFYLVLEYVEGQSLRTLLDQHGSLRPDLALHIARQIADGLAAAHAAGIVHRDLKPDNVMLLSKDGDEYFVKVLDFGIAKIELGGTQNQLTQLGSVFGTPEYMAPEQAAGTPVDARADLYTLGVILYEMLSGATPFKDDDLVVVLTRQMTADPPPLPASVDPIIGGLVTHLLAKDPDQRPESAAGLVARIDAIAPSVQNSSPHSVAQPLTPSPVSVTAVSGAERASLADANGPASVAFSETVLSLPGPVSIARAQPARLGKLDALFDKAPILRRNLDLAGQPVPVWAVIGAGVVAGALLVVLLGGLLLAHGVSSSSKPNASASGAAQGSAPQPGGDAAELAGRAAKGDRDAITKLAARSESSRSGLEWRALGRGYASTGQLKPSLGAYKKALAAEPGYAKDKEVVADIRRAALDSDTSEAALNLALAGLGATGADLIYDVWSTTRSKADAQEVSRAAKQILDGTAIRSKASPALLVALDLSKAKGCAAAKEVLPRAVESADKRSYSKLKSFSARSGCGFLGLGDCYSCLRTGGDLQDAIKAADDRPAPTF